jgi:hypothetical protein
MPATLLGLGNVSVGELKPPASWGSLQLEFNMFSATCHGISGAQPVLDPQGMYMSPF